MKSILFYTIVCSVPFIHSSLLPESRGVTGATKREVGSPSEGNCATVYNTLEAPNEKRLLCLMPIFKLEQGRSRSRGGMSEALAIMLQ